jgi:hypothetical protein
MKKKIDGYVDSVPIPITFSIVLFSLYLASSWLEKERVVLRAIVLDKLDDPNAYWLSIAVFLLFGLLMSLLLIVQICRKIHVKK